MRIVIPVITIGILVACQHHAGSDAIRSRAAEGPAAEDPARLQQDPPFGSVASALGFPSLRDTALPRGYREVRIADGYSWIAGQRTPMLRLQQGPHGLTGELVEFWREGAESSASRGHCVKTAELHVCASIISSPSLVWDTVADRLREYGVWDISARCENLTTVSDAGTLLIQRRDGGQFETYSCNAPRSRLESNVGRQAAAIFSYIYLLTRSARK